ncbi:MAG: ATP-binding protein [Lachnospiraceae bacterium]|nr:ATP-binding protein [Lachnospiraceae bacterium]
MKLLRVKASHFKNCRDDFTIDFVAQSKKTAEDKEYELQEIADSLYVFNTAAFIGKNASGKTTAIELLDCCYSILGDFRLEGKKYSYENITLEMIFYHENYIYRYRTVLHEDSALGNKAIFSNQTLERKKYAKTSIKNIYEDDQFKPVSGIGILPEDTSIVFFVLKKKETRAVYFDSNGEGTDTYQLLFKAMKSYSISGEYLTNIIKIFDETIRGLERIDDHNYRLIYQDKEQVLSDKELIYLLSSGTTKGLLLYILVVASLQNGFDLLIDEVENHFHKTLVENMISLYKDKTVNRKNATLIFTTHYCEVLDLFNRQDNIWISKSDGQVYLSNMYKDYNVRPELLKSRQFYNNAFQTSVNYDELMNLKRKLKKVQES